ncbi:MAG: YkgJ family cysteine cluster protein [Thermodesulfovibrionales bacterium]|nr:YkgJ family cysteine cluster protein [Thermodesulfovibrionales bacterium]
MNTICKGEWAQRVGEDKNRKSVPNGKHDAHDYDEEKEKILSVALGNMVMINGKVYGLEDDSEPNAFVDCASKISSCRAGCCSYVFALTQEEVKKGFYPYNPDRPYYMARDADGFCPYLDRVTFFCRIHERRPLRCRKYTCEPNVRGFLQRKD